MLIKVVYQATGEDVRVEFSFGQKFEHGMSYVMARRGALEMKATEWAHFQEVLQRGAKRPVTVVIEQATA